MAEQALTSVLGGTQRGQILIPSAIVALNDPNFAGFSVEVEPFEEYPYDGKFHPSTHATWTVRQLYLYLVAPLLLEPERRPLNNVLAVTAGRFWHRFFQQLWLISGDLVLDEVALSHEPTNRVGHADGLLANGEGLEIKCVVPSTLLEMADGTRRKAAEIKVGDQVIGWREGGSYPARVVDVWDNGIQPTITTETREGKSLATTSNHPFLTQRGWIKAENLIVGDRVRCTDVPQWAAEMKCLDPEEAHALGVLVGDGGLTGQVIYLTSADSDIVERMQTYALNQGAELVKTTAKYGYRFRVPRQHTHTTGNPILNRLREQGLAGCSSHTKRVPPAVWQGGPEAWAQFLSGYFDADGTVVTVRTGTYPHLCWGSVSKGLLLDCQILLARLGIRSSIVKQVGRYRDQSHLSWKLMIRDRAAVVRAQQVLVPWCQRKAADLHSLEPGTARPGHIRTAEFGWDYVSAVTRGSDQPTVGIQVEGGTHLTNGIVTHNTINEYQVLKITDEAALREKKFDYWAQAQDYLAMANWEVMRFFFVYPGWPFPMSEFVVKADAARQATRRSTYLQALELAAAHPDPDFLQDRNQAKIAACCSPGSAAAARCPVRLACPIGRAES